MQHSARRLQITFFIIAMAISIVVYFLFTKNSKEPAAIEAKAAPEFGINNYSIMKTDTFVALVQSAYSGFASNKVEDKRLEINIKNANEITKDFFNGNDALLKFKLSDYGFEIKYNPEEPSVVALFKITEGNGVHVPNDVLIKLMDKTNKINNVDYTK